MADKYTVKKVQGGTWRIVRIDNGKVVRRGLSADQALQDAQRQREEVNRP